MKSLRVEQSRIVRFIAAKSKTIHPPGFQGISLYEVSKFFWDQIQKTALSERAAAISFNFIMAIPPSCLFLFTLIPHLPFVPIATIRDQLHHLITDIIPAKEYNSNLIQFVDSFLTNQKTGLLSFGFILLLFFASNGMMGLLRSFNKDYLGFQRRTNLASRWTAIKLTFMVMGLLFACLALLITHGALLKWLGIKNQFLLQIIMIGRWVFIIGLIFSIIGFIYKYAPAVDKRWKFASPGTILATLLSIVASVGFTVFISYFGRYNALYGSIGTIIVLMILIFLNAWSLLIGYELNVSILSLRIMAEERQKGVAGGAPRA
ncbi:MAG: YihY/virulence factor BrkB family protein [Gemmatimonadaceae bacterium]|nr:YihY/virulence factor BrkB family protein [Chitinophagaceae bacterium]